MASPRLSRVLAYAWVVALALAVVGPALLPGFVLSYDLVFTPRQDLLPASLGVGSGLPRAVPQDAVVAVLEMVVPGMVLEKVVLLAIPLLAGFGILRLLPSTAAGLVAATLAVANPFLAQRLVIGHWGFLLAYALLPWALVLARRLRASGDPWDGVRLLLVIAAGSLTPSGSLLLAAVAVPPVLLPRSAYTLRAGVMLVLAVVATWLPWLLPALLHPAATGADAEGTRIFSLRADAPGGLVATALSGGGIWNSEVVLASRGTALTWVVLILVVALAAWGARDLVRILGRGVAAWWTLVAGLGLLAALASAMLPGPWAWLLETAEIVYWASCWWRPMSKVFVPCCSAIALTTCGVTSAAVFLVPTCLRSANPFRQYGCRSRKRFDNPARFLGTSSWTQKEPHFNKKSGWPCGRSRSVKR